MLGRSVSALAALAALAGCSRSYHPEYHPETSYSYVQNVTYAQNAWYLGDGAPAATDASPALPARDDGTCKPYGPHICFRECYQSAKSESCYVLGVMFTKGDRVYRSPENARKLFAKACELGDCRPPPTDANVSSPGTVVVYGNVYGQIHIGR